MVSTTSVSVYHLTSILLTKYLQVASDNVDIGKTSAFDSEKNNDNEIDPVGSPQDPFTNDSATATEPHSIKAAGDPANLDKSAAPFTYDSATTTEPHSLNAAGDPANLDKSTAMDVDDAVSVDIGNTQDRRDDEPVDAENSAPQPLTSAKETSAPDWLKRMLVYLRGVSDSTEWQDLVSALLKFENLNPPSGVGAILHTNFLLI